MIQTDSGPTTAERNFHEEILNRPLQKKIGLIFAVGACNAVLGYNVLINSTIQLCVEEWGMSLTAVQQISQVPSLLCLVGSLLAAAVIGRFGRRTVGIVGMAVLVITGILPAIFTSMGFWGILIARAIGGIFTGFILPIGTSMVADYFEGTQRRVMMGVNMAFGSLVSGVILNQVAGALCAINWRMTYWVFAFFLLFFILAFFIPKTGKEQLAEMRAAGQAGKFSDIFKQSGKVWKYCIFLFFFLIVGHIHSITASTIIFEKALGGPVIIGTSFSVMTAGGVLGALTYAFFTKPLKKFSAPVLFLITAVGLIIAATATSLPVFLFGIFLGCGVCFTSITSMINSLVGSNAATGATVGALALANIAYNGGQYFTNLVLNPVGAGIFGADDAGNPLGSSVYLAGACLALLLCIASLISALKQKQGTGDHLLDF